MKSMLPGFSFTAADVVPCGGRKKSLPTSSYCRLYILALGIIGLILSQFEYRVPLKPVLEGAGSVGTLHY